MDNKFENQASRKNEDFIFRSDMIICTLLNKERNKKLLQSIPFTPVHDMAVIFRYLLKETKAGLCTTIITNKMLEEHQIDRATLLLNAIKNTERLFPAKVQVMTDVIASLGGFDGILTPEEEKLFQDTGDRDNEMYVLTNQTGILGANVIIYHHLLENLADRLQSSLIVIPSSVHESIIIKADFPIEAATKMLQDINSSCVSEDEILSERALFFEWSKEMRHNANFLI